MGLSFLTALLYIKKGVLNIRILVVEDELDMLKIIRLYLEKAGHEVGIATDGEQALEELYNQNYDLIISDWMMPHMSGLELCRRVRDLEIPVKIIMLTAKSQVSDEIIGLKEGADDYIKKPFEPQLLLLRIEKMFNLENELKCKDISLNFKTSTVFVRGKELKLTNKEWLLLEYLMKNKGTTLSRNKLIETVWGLEYDGDERTLDTHIKRLRDKIGKEYITTFVGIGYRLDEPNEQIK